MLFGTASFEPAIEPTGVRDQVEQGRDYGRGFWSQQWLRAATACSARRGNEQARHARGMLRG